MANTSLLAQLGLGNIGDLFTKPMLNFSPQTSDSQVQQLGLGSALGDTNAGMSSLSTPQNTPLDSIGANQSSEDVTSKAGSYNSSLGSQIGEKVKELPSLIPSALGAAGSDAINLTGKTVSSLGDAVGKVTSPIQSTLSDTGTTGALQNVLQTLLGGVNKNFAMSDYGPGVSMAEDTLNKLPVVGGITKWAGLTPQNTGTMPNNNSTGANSTGSATTQDPLIDSLQQKITQYGQISSGSPALTAKYAPFIKDLQDQLKNAREAQVSERANQGAVGIYPAGSAGAQQIASDGADSERMFEAVNNLKKAALSNNPQELEQAAHLITTDTALIEGFKRIPGGSEALGQLEDAYGGGSMEGWLDKTTGVIVPSKIEGTLKGLLNSAQISQNNYDTELRQARIYDSSTGKGNIDTAKLYNKYYGTPFPDSNDILGTGDFSPSGALASNAINQNEEAGKQAGAYQVAGTAGKITGGYGQAKKLFASPPINASGTSQALKDAYDYAIAHPKNPHSAAAIQAYRAANGGK